MFPYDLMLDVQYIIDEIRNYNMTSAALISSLGLDNAKGFVRATKDPKVLDQLEQSMLVSPGITKHDAKKLDQLNVKELDKITIDQNMYLEFHGGKNKEETVIIPIEI